MKSLILICALAFVLKVDESFCANLNAAAITSSELKSASKDLEPQASSNERFFDVGSLLGRNPYYSTNYPNRPIYPQGGYYPQGGIGGGYYPQSGIGGAGGYYPGSNGYYPQGGFGGYPGGTYGTNFIGNGGYGGAGGNGGLSSYYGYYGNNYNGAPRNTGYGYYSNLSPNDYGSNYYVTPNRVQTGYRGYS